MLGRDSISIRKARVRRELYPTRASVVGVQISKLPVAVQIVPVTEVGSKGICVGAVLIDVRCYASAVTAASTALEEHFIR